ncbi:MAG TPA: general secretion pathway protein GspB [Xanthomonadales bacterium]|nr:general secretion pathway protein GspB [Xanthomonadales bacterium]
MSILLDALKKSESQRQLGTTPTLGTPAFHQEAGSQGEHSWIPVVMSLSAAAIILWTGLAQFRQVSTVAGQSVATIEAIPPEPPARSPGGSPGENPVPPATTPMMEYKAAPPPILEDLTASLTQEQADPQELTIAPFSIAGQEQPARDTVVPVGLRPAGAEKPVILNQQGQGAAESMRTPNSAHSQVPDNNEPGAAGTAGTDDQLEPYLSEPISYWQIPQSVRDSMGELRVSVLVYADDPQDRFLLVNGQRLHEKEELSDGLLLLEIQRDRAIFSYRNYRFQLKS